MSMEALLLKAGVDVVAAKAALAELDNKFSGEAGDIPDGALYAWVDQFFDSTKTRRVFFLFGKELEAALEVPKDRKWEKVTNAAEIKAQRNLEKRKK